MSQFNAQAYDVSKPTGQCALTGRTLEAGETYIATLVEDGDDLRRVDVSLEAWDGGGRPEQVFSYWRAVAAEREAKKKLFVDDGVLMNLVERLADATAAQRIAFRFVLMLILMRKKLLRYDATESRAGQSADGAPGMPTEADWWIVTPKADLSKGPLGRWDDQRRFEVLDPRLDEQGIQAVMEQLSEILQAEL